MENICIDTDVLVDFLRAEPEAIEFVMANELNSLATTYINVFELYYGAMGSSSKERNLAAVDKLVSQLRILNLSRDSVREAGRILADLERKGMQIDFRDMLIGTIALAEGFSLKTKNIKHFSRIPGLRVFED